MPASQRRNEAMCHAVAAIEFVGILLMFQYARRWRKRAKNTEDILQRNLREENEERNG
jgi:hypothetical protein